MDVTTALSLKDGLETKASLLYSLHVRAHKFYNLVLFSPVKWNASALVSPLFSTGTLKGGNYSTNRLKFYRKSHTAAEKLLLQPPGWKQQQLQQSSGVSLKKKNLKICLRQKKNKNYNSKLLLPNTTLTSPSSQWGIIQSDLIFSASHSFSSTVTQSMSKTTLSESRKMTWGQLNNVFCMSLVTLTKSILQSVWHISKATKWARDIFQRQ